MKKVNQVFFILLLIFTLSACTEKTNPMIGEPYQGGIVFYILKKGDAGYDSKVIHGLIVSIEDQVASTEEYGEYIAWSTLDNGHKSVTGTRTKIGSGSANTDKIIAQNGIGINYAAGLARAYQGGGYTDWYLPSKDELNKLYKAKDSIEEIDKHRYYWSSSEFEAEWSSLEYEAEHSWNQSFYNGRQDYIMKSGYGISVRAIRSF